jgi:hypothetical protein
MRPLIITIKRALAGSTLLLLSACTKIIKQPPLVVSTCSIQRLEIEQFNPVDSNEILITFLFVSYNAAGNPTDVVTSPAAAISPYDYHFRYDNYGRLTDFIINNTGGSTAVNWHRYSYPNQSTIIDSTYENGGLIDGPPPTPSAKKQVNFYYLDDQLRIISNTERTFGSRGTITTTNYSYDRNGNLIRNGVLYDKNTCLYRTNYLWMFLNKDFSRNNPVSDSHLPLTYREFGPNANGLPDEFASGLVFNDEYENGLLFNYLTMSMIYNCNANSKAE